MNTIKQYISINLSHYCDVLVNFFVLRRYNFSEILFCFSVIFIFSVYYPGAMTGDSLWQFEQALLRQYSDWHPPVMSFLWSKFLFFSNGPLLMLIFHLSMLSLGIWILYLKWNKYSRLSFLFLLMPIFPPIMCISGVIWKDVGFAFALLLSYALYFYAQESLAYKKVLYLLSVLFFVYAFFVRSNALFACIPLIFFALNDIYKSTFFKTALTTFFCIVVLVCMNLSFTYVLLKAEKRNPEKVMIIDEIAATSVIANENLFFEEAKIVYGLSVEDLPAFHAQKGWHFYQTGASSEALFRNWLSVIKNHPYEYMLAKIILIQNFMLNYAVGENIDIVSNKYGLVFTQVKDSFVGKVFLKINSQPILKLLCQKFFWFALSLVLLLYSLFPKNTMQVHIRALSASGLMYFLGFFLVIPTPDYRFIYWPVIATTISTILLVMDFAENRHSSPVLYP